MSEMRNVFFLLCVLAKLNNFFYFSATAKGQIENR